MWDFIPSIIIYGSKQLIFYGKFHKFIQSAVENVAVNKTIDAFNASTVCVLPEFPFSLVF